MIWLDRCERLDAVSLNKVEYLNHLDTGGLNAKGLNHNNCIIHGSNTGLQAHDNGSSYLVADTH